MSCLCSATQAQPSHRTHQSETAEHASGVTVSCSRCVCQRRRYVLGASGQHEMQLLTRQRSRAHRVMIAAYLRSSRTCRRRILATGTSCDTGGRRKHLQRAGFTAKGLMTSEGHAKMHSLRLVHFVQHSFLHAGLLRPQHARTIRAATVPRDD